MRSVVEIKCVFCGKDTKVHPWDIKRGWGKFCSIECLGKHKTLMHPPESKHRLNSIARAIYIDRNGEPVCQKCGKLPADIHHIDGNRKNNSEENHQPLCRSCHVAHHNHLNPKRTRNETAFVKSRSFSRTPKRSGREARYSGAGGEQDSGLPRQI